RNELGVGEFAISYRAYDRVNDRMVCVKVLHDELTPDSDAYDKYVRAPSRHKHRNMVRQLSAHTQELPHFLITELPEGETLAEKIRRGRLPLQTALKYIVRIADALSYAHDRGFLHLRLRPSEVRIDSEDEPMLSGFRTAELLAHD